MNDTVDIESLKNKLVFRIQMMESDTKTVFFNNFSSNVVQLGSLKESYDFTNDDKKLEDWIYLLKTTPDNTKIEINGCTNLSKAFIQFKQHVWQY